jgi:hypothetical protein
VVAVELPGPDVLPLQGLVKGLDEPVLFRVWYMMYSSLSPRASIEPLNACEVYCGPLSQLNEPEKCMAVKTQRE